MTMQSSNLLPALRELPGGESGQNRSFRDTITGIVNMDRAMHAAEFASAVSFGMWPIFEAVNVDDVLAEAYQAQYPNLADDHSLHEHWQEVLDRGPESMGGFISGLKGKLAEFETNRLLEADGWSDMISAPSPDHQFWDSIGINPDGKVAVIQSKTGGSYSNSDVQDWMVEDHPNLYEQVYADVQKWVEDLEIIENHPELETIAERLADGPASFVSDRYFAFGSELYGKAVPSGIDEAGRIVADIGPDYELVEGTKDGLTTLSDNMGIDILDGVGEIIPYASAILASARLIMNVIKTEQEFKTVDRTAKNKVQIVQTLTLLSRMGPKTALSIVGGKGGVIAGGALGTLAGTVAPGVGNAIGGTAGSIGGGIAGALAGYKTGSYLSKHLEPHALRMALNITGMTNDDLFYYKNKVRIDDAALSYQERARALAAPA